MVQIINGEFPPSDAEVFLAGLQKGFALASSGPSATLWKYLKWLAGALGRVPWVFAFRGALALLVLAAIWTFWCHSQNGRYELKSVGEDPGVMRVLDTRTGAVKLYVFSIKNGGWFVLDAQTGQVERRLPPPRSSPAAGP